MSQTLEPNILDNTHLTVVSTPSAMNNTTEISVPEGCVTTDMFPFIPWDNEDNIIPKEVDNYVKLILTGICISVLFLISFSTNTVNMIVFYRHGLHERINACLFTLSLVDLLGIAAAFSYSSDIIYMYAIGKIGDLGYTSAFFTDNYIIGLTGLITATQMVYSFIALERCLCVSRPLLVKSFLSTKTTVVALWTMVLLITGLSVFVVGVRFDVLCVFDTRDASVTIISFPTNFYFRHKIILDALYSGVYGLFFPLFSLVCVSVCTVITAIQLKQLTQWREKVSSASSSVTSRDLAIARVIIGTSVLFIICIIPAILVRTAFLIVPGFRAGGRYDNLAWVALRCYQVASAINTTFNFFVYYNYGSKFRETTHALFPVLFAR